MDTLRVKEYMEYQPAAIRCDAMLTEVIDELLKHKSTGAPVVNEQNEVVGFVSEQDCLRSLLVSGYYCDKVDSVKDVMRREVLTIGPEDNVVELARRMTDQLPKIYPVVLDGKLIGLIDRRRILSALVASQVEHCKVW
ncbi:CBS domain protein [Sinobacterium caligoides]|uniref:CBS domain protein n=1 Tax=Sinobacterium caligoides TaxID=933926 RepID=A0A3N2DPV6_9GAMM|nr:CBS domain-containing protein [Sinobacterium caligoides]ROS01864.1 CBS domain protein [Sinobacterium caligoides]